MSFSLDTFFKAEEEWGRTHEPRLRAEIEMDQMLSNAASGWKELELQAADRENTRVIWLATEQRKKSDCTQEEWAKNTLVDDHRSWETTVLRTSHSYTASKRSHEVEAMEAECQEVEEVQEENRNKRHKVGNAFFKDNCLRWLFLGLAKVQWNKRIRNISNFFSSNAFDN